MKQSTTSPAPFTLVLIGLTGTLEIPGSLWLVVLPEPYHQSGPNVTRAAWPIRVSSS